MPTGARKIQGYSEISEQVVAQESIIRQVSNLDVEGTPGFTTLKVYVNELATVADYVPGTGVALSNDSSAYVDLVAVKEKGINEILDGYTVETAPADLVSSRLEAAFSALGEQKDTDALAQMVADGTELIAAAGLKPTAVTIYKDILALKKALDVAKAPKRDRSLLLSPDMEEIALDVDAKLVLNTDRGDTILQEGFIGKIAGFALYGTVLLPAATNMVAMQKRGFAYKDNWKKEPALISLDGSSTFYGDSAIKARNAYVYGVIRPTFVQVNNGAA